MARVWQRLAVAAFSACLVVVLSQCKALKPQAGQPCVSNGKLQCVDPSTALLCQNSKLVNLPCRGPRGCRGMGTSSTCDDDLSLEGDACQQTLNDNYSCSVDHTKELLCKSGVFTTVRTCKGPKKCTVTGDMINCDDSLADVGDLCVVDPGDANYGCSTDKKIEVVCDGTTSKFQSSNTCRGPKGCFVENEHVFCDQAMARIGDKCRPVDNHSCSEDSTQELKCSAQFVWAKQRDCKKDGCKIKNNEVYCD
jgi:hypothetical protein